MARSRRKTSATGGNMDSMLDTLTNVVGILVIVLVAVQLSSQEAASRIADAVAKIDPEEVERIKQAAVEAREAADEAREALDREKNRTRLDPEKELARLEEERRKAEEKAKEDAQKAEDLTKRHEDAEKKEKAERERLEKQIAELKARIDEAAKARELVRTKIEGTEKPSQPPDKQVRMPNPRPVPQAPGGKAAVAVQVLCEGGRVIPIVDAGIRADVEKRLGFLVGRRQLDPEKDNWLPEEFKGKKVVDLLGDDLPNNRDFRLSLEVINKRVYVVLEPKKSAGETAQEAKKGDFLRGMRLADPSGIYFRYWVQSDSFETYLEMREFTDEAGFLAGWEPVPPGFRHKIPTKYAIGTKPPPAPAPAPGTTPPKPPPPPNVLD
jgi:hypothetical protein